MKFIGTDSLGYKHNKIYNVEIKSESDYIYILCPNHVPCPYQSLNLLMKKLGTCIVTKLNCYKTWNMYNIREGFKR